MRISRVNRTIEGHDVTGTPEGSSTLPSKIRFDPVPKGLEVIYIYIYARAYREKQKTIAQFEYPGWKKSDETIDTYSIFLIPAVWNFLARPTPETRFRYAQSFEALTGRSPL